MKGFELTVFLIRESNSPFSTGYWPVFKGVAVDLCFVSATSAFSLEVTAAQGDEKLTFIFPG